MLRYILCSEDGVGATTGRPYEFNVVNPYATELIPKEKSQPKVILSRGVECMGDLPVSMPKAALKDLEWAVFRSETRSGSVLQLVITMQDRGLIVRDFSAYLRIIDGFYGKLQTAGYLSYAHRLDRQLRITNIKQGSLDLIFSEILETVTNPYLIVVWLALKYLPNIIKASADLARAYRDIEEGRLARVNRQQIRAEIRRDEALQGLGADRIRQLCSVLDGLYTAEHNTIGKAIRFAKKHVKEVKITLKEPDEHSD